jgi:LysR family L-lactate utilization transcriptional regulator
LKICFDDIFIFCKVVEHGSIKAASAALKLPSPTISRRISTLEDSLSLQLMIRGNHKLKPTNIGRRYYELFHPQLSSLSQSMHIIDNEQSLVSGDITLDSPAAIFNSHLKSPICKFMKQYPDVNLDLQSRSFTEQKITKNTDIAILLGELPDSDLIAKKLGTIEMVLIVSAVLMKNKSQITIPNDLRQLMNIEVKPSLKVVLTDPKSREQEKFEHKPNLIVHQIYSAKAALLEGLGYCYMPKFCVEEELKSGLLVELLPEWTLDSTDMHIVYRSRENQPLAQKLLIDALYQWSKIHFN